MERKAFKVIDLHKGDIFILSPLNENSWSQNYNGQELETEVSNDAVQEFYDYVTSMWMDFEVEVIN